MVSKISKPKLFDVKNGYIQFRCFGLKPNTVYNFYREDKSEDLTAQTQRLVKGSNYKKVFNYYKQNVKSRNKNILGDDFLLKPDNEVHYEVCFEGYTTSADGFESDVVSLGNTGEPLLSDDEGMLFFYYYNNEYINDSLLISQTGLAPSSYDNLVNKKYIIKTPSGSSSVTVVPYKQLLKQTSASSVGATTELTVIEEGSISSFDSCQTFFIDPNSVKNATEVNLSSIELYFKNKPSFQNQSGIAKPGVTIFIVPTVNRIPVITDLQDRPFSRLEYDNITSSTDANIATKFTFSNTITLATNKEYGIVIKFDNGAQYSLWASKLGENIVGTTNIATGGVGQYIGNYYRSTTTNSWQPVSDTDLKFKVNVARYAVSGVPINTTNSNIIVKNSSYEFITFNEINSEPNFYGSELVYQVQANATGTVSVSNTLSTVTGTGTSFSTLFTQGSDAEYIVAVHASGITEIKQVVDVISNTSIVVESPFKFTNTASNFYKAPVAWMHSIKKTYDSSGGTSKLLILNYSQANSSLKFSNGGTIIGSVTNSYVVNTSLYDYPVSRMAATFVINKPAEMEITSNAKFNYSLSTTNILANANPAVEVAIAYDKDYIFDKEQRPAIPSRSNELALLPSPTYASDTGNSVTVTITPTFKNDFLAPKIHSSASELLLYRYVINNDWTNEHTKYGNAHSKHITTKINLSSNVYAEDLLVYLNAYRPANTGIKLYAKLHNKHDPDAFDDKDWTLMRYDVGRNSRSYNRADINEYTFSLRMTPNTAFISNGFVTATVGQSNIVGSSTTFNTDFAADDLVKVYPTLFPGNYEIAVVNNVVNSSLLTLKTNISNIDVSGSGLKIAKLGYKHQAFNNKNNDNIVRYYNSGMTPFDSFNTFSLKIVLLSNDPYHTPYVSGLRAVAVST
jgi:hypothetical protein